MLPHDWRFSFLNNIMPKQLIKLGLRKCFVCKKILQLNSDNFHPCKYNNRFNGFQYACKPCARLRKSEWREKNPGKESEYQKHYNKNKRKNKIGLLKLRFNVFNRDSFTCQYCGRKAPDIVLEIDHVIPKSKGGLNNIENLKSCCSDCNQGKKNSIISTG